MFDEVPGDQVRPHQEVLRVEEVDFDQGPDSEADGEIVDLLSPWLVVHRLYPVVVPVVGRWGRRRLGS